MPVLATASILLGLLLSAGAVADERLARSSTLSAGGASSEARGWVPLRSSRVRRTEVAAAAVGRSIYVVGGFTNAGAPTRQVERYDTRRDRWELVKPMPIAVNHAAAVGYRGDLYVLGGYTGAPFSFGIGTGGVADATSAFFRYDPETDSWSRMPSAPTRRAAMAAAVIGDELHVAGGADSLRPLTAFEIFNFKHGTWRRGPDMPRPTEHTAGAAANGEFYVVSGRPSYVEETNRFVQRYSPRTGRWERVADLMSGRGGLAAVSVCDGVVAFGGEDPHRGPPGTVPEVEVYDPVRDSWDRLPDMRTPRHGLGGAVIDRRIYALEGGDITLVSITDTAEALDVQCQLPDREVPGQPPDREVPDGTRDGSRQPGARKPSGHGGETTSERANADPRANGRPPAIASRPSARHETTDGFLPFTGADLVALAACGIGLLFLGAALRRRQAR